MYICIYKEFRFICYTATLRPIPPEKREKRRSIFKNELLRDFGAIERTPPEKREKKRSSLQNAFLLQTATFLDFE